MLDWWTTEGPIRDANRQLAQEASSLVDRAAVLLRRAFLHAERRSPDDFTLAMTLALAQFHDALRVARELAFTGYAAQSLAVTRLALEYQILLMYLPQHPNEATLWLDFRKRPKTNYGSMAEAIFPASTPEGASLLELRRALDSFAHVDNIAFANVIDNEGGVASIRMGPRKSAKLVNLAAIFVLSVASLGLQAAAGWLGESDGPGPAR